MKYYNIHITFTLELDGDTSKLKNNKDFMQFEKELEKGVTENCYNVICYDINYDSFYELKN